MRKIALILCAMVVFGSLFLAVAAGAETMYVSDELIITLREGKGTQYRIIKSLKTGTPVTVLEEGDKYFKVRIKSGEEGYVLRQYMTPEIPKKDVIASLENKLERLNQQLKETDKGRGSLQEELTSVREDQRLTLQQLQEKTAALQALEKKYEDLKVRSQNVLSLSEERDRLQSENTQISAELISLREENKSLMRTAMIQWFLAGGGVFFIGWLIGKVSRKNKKRGGF